MDGVTKMPWSDEDAWAPYEGLRLRRGTDRMGYPEVHVVWDGERKPSIAQTAYTITATTLAEPLRRAFSKHVDEHGCAARTGFAYCDEAMRLFRLLPDGDRVIVG